MTGKQQQTQRRGEDFVMADMAEIEENYYEITGLYDLAEELVDSVESEFCHDPELQLQIVEPLIDEIGESADILCEEYIAIMENRKPRKSNSRIESALRRIYTAIDAYHQRVDQSVQGMKAGFRNIADPAVKKLTRLMESIVAILIDYVQLSLDRIMTNQYADELRKRQEKIAMMLHSIGQGQGAS